MAKEENDYLAFLGIRLDDDINKKLMVFSSAVKRIYSIVRKEVSFNRKYIYEDDEEILSLIYLRSNILSSGYKVISDSLNIMFDYICIKCSEPLIDIRYITPYYREPGNKSFDKKKIINDIVPYLFPNTKDEALKILSGMRNDSLHIAVPAAIMLYHNVSYDQIYRLVHRTLPRNIKYEDFLSKSIHIIDEATGVLFRYIKGGPGFFVYYNQEIRKEAYPLMSDMFLDSDRALVKPIEEMHHQQDSESLNLSSVLLSSSDCGGVIIISESDYQVYNQMKNNRVTLAKLLMRKYDKNSMLISEDNVTQEQYEEAISIYKLNGEITIELSNDYGFTNIVINIPDVISDYQKTKLIEIKRELSRIRNEMEKKQFFSISISSVDLAITSIDKYFMNSKRNQRKKELGTSDNKQDKT